MVRSIYFLLAVGFCMMFFSVPEASATTPYTFKTIDFPGAIQTAANGNNDGGQIVGVYYVGSRQGAYGFLFSDGIFTSIDYPGAADTQPLGINNNGQVVGFYLNPSCPNGYGCSHPFLYSNGCVY